MIMAKEKPEDKGDRNATLFLRGLSRKIKNRFKAWCARRGVSMHDKIVELMLETLEGEKK